MCARATGTVTQAVTCPSPPRVSSHTTFHGRNARRKIRPFGRSLRVRIPTWSCTVLLAAGAVLPRALQDTVVLESRLCLPLPTTPPTPQATLRLSASHES